MGLITTLFSFNETKHYLMTYDSDPISCSVLVGAEIQ